MGGSAGMAGSCGWVGRGRGRDGNTGSGGESGKSDGMHEDGDREGDAGGCRVSREQWWGHEVLWEGRDG